MKRRFLVLHDYGMGGLWWWVHARSAREVEETFAEAEVVDDPEMIARFTDEDLDEVDVDDPVMPPGLDDMRATRDAQRHKPGFGALADREVVHLRRRWDAEEPAIYLLEVGHDGRRIRQVELTGSGPGWRGTPDDWAFNPPAVDIYDPELAGQQIGKDEFERAWESAVPEPADDH